jgi:class 3 adenylate cyclase
VFLNTQFTSHVEKEWSQHFLSRGFSRLAQRTTLVRIDLRGTGLSDRSLPPDLKTALLDIEAVVKGIGVTQFALAGVEVATPIAIAYAAERSGSVHRLILIDPLMRMSDILATPQAQALLAAAQIDWTTATEAIGAAAFGFDRLESRDWGIHIRSCIDTDYIALLQDESGAYDASEFAARITTPTLIIKHASVQYVTMEGVRELASIIASAQFATVEGYWGDSHEQLMDRVAEFAGAQAPAPEHVTSDVLPGSSPPGTAIILFADIVDSTALTERLGDDAFREKARGLDVAMRAAIRENGGTAVEGRTLGDGVLAVFTSAKQAIGCARACHDAAGAAGLALHAGIHAGDVIREADNVYGGAVNIASRISGLSAPGEVLVSDTVRSLARTSAGVAFEDRGEQALKGIEEPVRVFAVRRDKV